MLVKFAFMITIRRSSICRRSIRRKSFSRFISPKCEEMICDEFNATKDQRQNELRRNKYSHPKTPFLMRINATKRSPNFIY